jgi:prepilin-type N-terminal cleavage/methylation domain-containing protein
MKNKKTGFTLFELLVSISIIAVMTAIAVVSFGGVSKKSRDARRISDLEKVRIALEAVRQIGNTYPVNTSTLIPNYLQKWPTDPKSTGVYTYAITNSPANTNYRVCAFVEDLGSTSSDVTGCSGLPAGYVGYYKVVNP